MKYKFAVGEKVKALLRKPTTVKIVARRQDQYGCWYVYVDKKNTRVLISEDLLQKLR
jgi:hypothetical protein